MFKQIIDRYIDIKNYVDGVGNYLPLSLFYQECYLCLKASESTCDSLGMLVTLLIAIIFLIIMYFLDKNRYEKENDIEMTFDKKSYMKQYRAENGEQIRKYQQEQWNILRNSLIDFFGGECERCGSDKYLELHHLDYPDGESRGNDKLVEVRDNPDNFLLLCKICHEALHKQMSR